MLQAFYQRLLGVYRHRYLLDHVRQTNFRDLPAPPVWAPPPDQKSFFTTQGYQASRAAPLKVHSGQVAAARRP